MNNLDNPELKQVIAESRILAINCKHDFINLEHFFVAMLTIPCLAQKYLAALDKVECLNWLQKQHAATGAKTIEDTLPLTIHMERIIKHSLHIARLQMTEHINSVHMLVAMLSYENQVSEKVKKAGVIFEDVAGGLPKQPLEIKLRHFNKSSRIATFFRLAPSVKKLTHEIYNHAWNLWIYQQYDECVTASYNGLQIAPEYDKFKILLAYCFFRKRDYTQSIQYFKEVVASYPDDQTLRFSLSLCYSKNGDHQQADEHLNQLLAQLPDNNDVLNNKGYSLNLQGKYAEAVPLFEKALEIAPTAAYPHNNLGFAKYKLGQTTEALQLIDRSLELDKGNSYAYKNKGIIYKEQGNNVLAMEQFQLALKYGFTETYGEEVLQLIKECQ